MLLFQRWAQAKVMVSEEDADIHGSGHTEVGDGQGFMSPDDNYRFSPAIAEHRPAVQRIAQILFLDQPQRYSDILWAASYELPSEVEEGALRWRQSRMEEHGFPPWEDALSVYAPSDGVRVYPRPPQPTDPESPVYPPHIAKTTCVWCHESERIVKRYGLAADRLSTYTDSYHGLADRAGSTEVANFATSFEAPSNGWRTKPGNECSTSFSGWAIA